MKLFIFVVAALATIQTAVSESYGEDTFASYSMPALLAENRDELEKTTENICPGYGIQMENVTKAVHDCLDDVDYGNETLCNAARRSINECALPVVTLLDECLPEQSKKIPKILVKMVGSGIDYLCKANGEHLMEYLNPCFRNVTTQSEACLKKFTEKFEEIDRTKKYPSAQAMCEFYESFRPCLQGHLEVACIHPITKESFLQFYDRLLDVCKTEYYNEIDSKPSR